VHVRLVMAYAVTRIGYVKLILEKIELKVKWFMFGYIYVKLSITVNLSLKINS